MPRIEHFGILARVDWSTEKWERPSPQDDSASTFSYVTANGKSHTSFNFANEIYTNGQDEKWQGMIPAFHSQMPIKENSKHVCVIFIESMNEGETYLVGMYVMPEIKRGLRAFKIPIFEDINEINIESESRNIIRFQNYLRFSELRLDKALGNKQNSRRGFNYLTKDNVFYILDQVDLQNRVDNKFRRLKLFILNHLQSHR